MKFLGLFLSLVLPLFANAAEPAWRAEFEEYIDTLMAEYKIPGLAIELVDENGPVLQITKGYRNLEKKWPVTAETTYAIGSTSKAFTGFLLAQLHDEGKIDFDLPVRHYRPDFRIQDEQASEWLNLRDLMGHWTGVGRHDLAWYQRPGTRMEMFHTIPYLDISAEPRKQFIYNNWMWVAAGVVAETVSGRTWEELLDENILSPLGMHSTSASLERNRSREVFALPYVVAGESLVETPFDDIGPANPAGGIYSNLNDMAKWIRLHLGKGSFEGRRLISESSLAKTYEPYAMLSSQVGYGMGWLSLPFGGERLLTHDGGVAGFTANVSLMPERKLGVVVLLNSVGISPEWIALRLWQHALGHEEILDWVRNGMKAAADAEAEAKKNFPDPERKESARPLAEYAGSYCHKAYGKAVFTVANDGLFLKLNAAEGPLYPVGENGFAIPGQYSPLKYVNFFAGEDGAIARVEWNLEASSDKPVRFERCAP